MNNEEDCIFCKIGRKEIEAGIIYEDDEVVGFLDNSPHSLGHTLVIPKDHFENLYALPGETLCRMSLAVQKVAIAVREATQADGINILMNNEPGGGQMVFHSHIHVIPRHTGDDWPKFSHVLYASDEEKNKLREKIKESLVDA